ncbi:hypothetical protein CIW48_23075 [Methylobacterium sp. P1-11]|nr:hypothetical protein CIW48_23075 [Methylobacterium sp. P1-11]
MKFSQANAFQADLCTPEGLEDFSNSKIFAYSVTRLEALSLSATDNAMRQNIKGQSRTNAELTR